MKNRRVIIPGGLFVAPINITIADQMMQLIPRSLPTGNFWMRTLDGYSLGT